jgi:hypothetical protein
MSQSLKVGYLVRKRAGYEYPGIIVSVFTTRAGAARYVVEADHPGFVGMLHILNGDQLEPRGLTFHLEGFIARPTQCPLLDDC